MHSESVIGRHFIQILFCVIGTLILHVHLPNYSKHSLHESSTQRNRLIHLILLLSGVLAVYWAGICFKPYEAVIQKIPLGSSLEPRTLASASYFFHTSAIEDCLHHLRPCIRPCPPVPMLLQTRRAAPVCKSIDLASAVVMHVQRLPSHHSCDSFSVCRMGFGTPEQWASCQSSYGLG